MVRRLVESENCRGLIDDLGQRDSRFLTSAKVGDLAENTFSAEEKLGEIGAEFSIGSRRVQGSNFIDDGAIFCQI
jgi:hypothetical protein